MVDLISQYDKIKPSVNKAIETVLNNATFINGPEVNEFKTNLQEYLNVKHVIPCANGTDALQISLMALGLKPGDEVITPSFTYIATTEVIALLNLKPIFVDVDKETFCLDSKKIEEAITPKTKAIVPVHLYGQAANMNEILEIAKKHNLFIVEDNAQAIGSDYKLNNGEMVKTGTLGDIGCTSFFPSKNLGCYGDGGALFTNNDELAKTIKQIANHGQSEKYYHDIVGCNSRLDSIQAAVLNIKLKNQLKLFGETMDISCSEERIMLTSNSQDSGKMAVEMKIDDLDSFAIDEGETLQVSFSLNYMQQICSCNKIAKEVEIKLSENYPLSVIYDLGEEASMKFYLAPKMNDGDN